LDLAVTNIVSSNVSILLNTGTGTYAAPVNYTAGTNPYSVAAGDYDGDGRGDLVTFAAQGTARLWRILQTGTNTFREVQWCSTAATDQVLPADYDGDGKTDVAFFRDGVWYLLRSQQGFTGVQFGTTNDRPIPAAFVP